MRILTVYLPAEKQVYVEGKKDVAEIRSYSVAGNFWYWRVVFDNGAWLEIAAPAILSNLPDE